MKFGKCKLCNKNISYENIRICQNCYDEKLEEVRKYIDENGKSTIDEISKGSGVPRRVVEQFYMDGVLYSNESADEIIERLKEKQRKLKNQAMIRALNSMYSDKNNDETKPSTGMHHFGRK